MYELSFFAFSSVIKSLARSLGVSSVKLPPFLLLQANEILPSILFLLPSSIFLSLFVLVDVILSPVEQTSFVLLPLAPPNIARPPSALKQSSYS